MTKGLLYAFFCCVFLSGCQKRDDDNVVEHESSKSVFRVEKKVELTSNRIHRGADLKSRDLAREVSLSMESWGNTGDIIASVRKSIKEFEHPQLREAMGADALSRALEDPRQMFEILKDEESHWNSNPELRSSAIAVCSLLCGFIGNPEEERIPRLPELFINAEFETERDMLMLQAAKQAVRLAESKKKIDDEAFREWLSMAHSPNEITRYTSLLLFNNLVDPTVSQSKKFFDSFANEKNELISEVVDLKLKKGRFPSK